MINGANIAFIGEKGLANRHFRLTDDVSSVFFLFPLVWRHAYDGLESAEEGRLSSKA